MDLQKKFGLVSARKLPLIYLLLLLVTFTSSLKCFNNYCAVGINGEVTTCVVDGDGTHEDCGNEIHGLAFACYEQPIDKESGQVKARGCATLKKSPGFKDAGCSEGHGERAVGHSTYGCICFEDFCNDRFNNTIKSKFRVVDGFLVSNSDDSFVHIDAAEAQEKHNDLE